MDEEWETLPNIESAHGTGQNSEKNSHGCQPATIIGHCMMMLGSQLTFLCFAMRPPCLLLPAASVTGHDHLTTLAIPTFNSANTGNASELSLFLVMPGWTWLTPEANLLSFLAAAPVCHQHNQQDPRDAFAWLLCVDCLLFQKHKLEISCYNLISILQYVPHYKGLHRTRPCTV